MGIGYWIAPHAEGNGLATRAAILLSRWALQSAGMIRAEALLDPHNIPSRRVVEKSGFLTAVATSFLTSPMISLEPRRETSPGDEYSMEQSQARFRHKSLEMGRDECKILLLTLAVEMQGQEAVVDLPRRPTRASFELRWPISYGIGVQSCMCWPCGQAFNPKHECHRRRNLRHEARGVGHWF